ncbi:hypothetical protein [Candidatus Aquicultor secundus]|nr:hypothetical protein [Candidatus Aquicultor secundus]
MLQKQTRQKLLLTLVFGRMLVFITSVPAWTLSQGIGFDEGGLGNYNYG